MQQEGKTYLGQGGDVYYSITGQSVFPGDIEIEKSPGEHYEYNKITKQWEYSNILANAETDRLRLFAFSKEADSLFFKQQRGEIPAGTWEAKVAEIKARFPKT